LKFILTEETLKIQLTTFYRIQAISNFSNVKSGDKGGWVQFEHNLSQYGDCWLYGESLIASKAHMSENATAYEYAWIYGNAVVCGDCNLFDSVKVFGNAKIDGNAVIHGDAKIYGDAHVTDKAWVFGNVLVHDDTVLNNTMISYKNKPLI